MKICTECKQKSYSASDRGEWYCPYCKENLTDIEPKTPDNNEDNKKEEE